MTAAAITAELVDVRNVGMHKCIKLTLHVPAERAAQVIEAFGWATAVDPVPVALVRLRGNNPKGGDVEAVQLTDQTPTVAQEPASDVPLARARKPIAPEKRLTQQAGILCADPMFIRFLAEELDHQIVDEKDAAQAVRWHCHVNSRSSIIPGSPAADKWHELHGRYLEWCAPGMAS